MADQTAIQKMPPQVAMTKHGFSPQTLDEAYRFSQGLARSNFVPEQYRGKPDDCLIALDLAARLNTHWLAIMQHVYIVHGRPGLDANLAIGLVNQSGLFEPIQYEVEGKDPRANDYRVRAYSKRIGSPIVLHGPWIDWQLVKAEKWDSKDGSKWKSMPEQMFHYRAGSWWQKRHCPEMTLGMPTADELSDAGPSTQYVESKTLEPTQGRHAFGFKKGEQPPETPPGEAPQDAQQPEETKARKCPGCGMEKTGKFYRSGGRLVCKECLAKANGTTAEAPQAPQSQDGTTEAKDAKEGGPATAPGIPPEAQCKCTGGHEFLGKDAATREDGSICCPECGQCIADIVAPNEQPSGVVTCKFGHTIGRDQILSSPVTSAARGELGVCPTCKRNNKITIIMEC